MNASRLFLALLLSTAPLAHLKAETESEQVATQQEQEQQGLQMLFACYAEINSQCKSIKFELNKNELDQALNTYLNIALSTNAQEAKLDACNDAIKAALQKMASYLDAHNTKHNSLTQIGDAKTAAVIVGIVHFIQVGQNYAQTIDSEEKGMRFQTGMQALSEFIPACLQ